MLFLSLLLVLSGAVACFGLSRRVATRTLGVVAAAACLAGAVAVALPGQAGPALELFAVGDVVLSLPPTMVPSEVATVALALGAGAACLLSLALALPGSLRGFGPLFGWALLGLAMLPPGLAVEPRSPLLAGLWSIAALAGYAAYRTSGALQRNDHFPLGISSALLAGLLLVGGLLGGGPVAALSLVGGALALAGAAPFQLTNREAMLVPAPLGALFYGIILPTLGLGTLLKTVPNLAMPPEIWGGGLLAIGSLGALACAAGMLRERSLRAMLGWSASMQASMIVAALGLAAVDRLMGELAARALLANLALSAAAGAAAVMSLEQATGSDEYTQPQPTARLGLAGLLWFVALASAIGIPPLWGFWGRAWLMEGVLQHAAWAGPLLVGAGVLALPALLVPLACFWHATAAGGVGAAQSGRSPLFGGLPAAAILVLAGIAPRFAVLPWLGAEAAAAVAPTTWAASLLAGAVLALFGLALGRGRWARAAAPDPDMVPTSMAPESLGEMLGPLAQFGHGAGLVRLLWRGLRRMSELLQLVMGFFEQRYYLLGVLLTLVLIMFLMAQ